jgi:peptidase E
MQTKTSPLYLLAGGRGRRDPAVQIVFRAFKLKTPHIAYVGAASEDNEEFFQHISGYLREMGAGEVALARTGKGARIARTQQVLTEADIIFVSGGDVELGMATLVKRGLDSFLKQLYREGKPFFGISAGSIMLAREWVRWRDPDDVNTSELFPCLGLADLLCDTHDEAAGWEELQAALMLKAEGALGYGIATGTGLRVSPGGRAEGLGGTVHRYIKKGDDVVRAGDLLPVA